MPDLTVKVRAVEKLLDYAASGVGAIAGPMLANWKAAKEGRARLTSARIDADVRSIEAESNAQSLVIIAEAQAQARQCVDTAFESESGKVIITREDITQSIEFQGRKRLANVASVVGDAADGLGDKKVSDHEPDPDWTSRFFDCVQDVSSEEMQKIWARILAGEVESPGRTSLRTLDTLRKMTKRDAAIFRDICDFVISGNLVFYDGLVKDFDALNYSKLLHLQDCELIYVDTNLTTRHTWGAHNYAVFEYYSGALMITTDKKPTGDLLIPAIRLTSVGKDLFLVADSKLNMGYLQVFSGFLNSKNCQLAYLQGIAPAPGGRISYMNKVPIEPKSHQIIDPTS